MLPRCFRLLLNTQRISTIVVVTYEVEVHATLKTCLTLICKAGSEEHKSDIFDTKLVFPTSRRPDVVDAHALVFCGSIYKSDVSIIG